MRRILALAYYFPPLGGAGVQRTVKLLKHLPSLGLEATVVTGPEEQTLAWAPPDPTLAADVPPGTAVHRLAVQPPQSAKWRRRADRWLDRPSAFQRWWIAGAVETARGAGPADVVYASMSPFETAVAANLVARERRLPWVADLRDPWALDEWTIYPTSLHRWRDVRRMRMALGSAAAVILNTPEAAREVGRRFPELAERLHVVPNGWDEADFETPRPPRSDGKFRIVYAGYSHVVSGRGRGTLPLLRRLLGGSTPGLGVLARSHAYLLEAVERLAEDDPGGAARVEVHLAGAAPAAATASPWLRSHGYLDHAGAVALVRSADLLFLPMHDLPPGFRTRTVPGKAYEYLASGRPILAALPDGDLRDMLAGLPGVRICRPTDVECMRRALLDFLSDQAPSPLERSIARRFERRQIAASLAEVLEGAVTP